MQSNAVYVTCGALPSLDILVGDDRLSDCMQCRSEHTLPVTSIHVGAGQANALAITSSLDRSCKIWGLAQGEHHCFSLGTASKCWTHTYKLLVVLSKFTLLLNPVNVHKQVVQLTQDDSRWHR